MTVARGVGRLLWREGTEGKTTVFLILEDLAHHLLFNGAGTRTIDFPVLFPSSSRFFFSLVLRCVIWTDAAQQKSDAAANG